MDVRGCLGLDDDYRNGFEQIRVVVPGRGRRPRRRSSARSSRGRRQRSAVFDMVTNGVPVSVDVATA